MPKYRIDSEDKIIKYIRLGCHAFIGCDDDSERERLSFSLIRALSDRLIECIDGNAARSRRDFALILVEACCRLVASNGGRFQPSSLGLAPALDAAMSSFSDSGRQGYLIFSNIDPVIQMQRTIEFEGPLRSIMQLRDDVSVILIGSNDTINEMVGDYKRPFYMSFRVFRH